MNYLNLIKLNATSSTNDTLKEGVAKGIYRDGDLLWTTVQTKGRGQRKNSWESEPKKNIAFSVYKEFEGIKASKTYLISCAVSIAIVEALTRFDNLKITVKWPNDIMAENQKMGGILIENLLNGHHLTAGIIGVGLNVNQLKFKNLPNATSMALQTRKDYNLETVLKQVVENLETTLFSIAASVNNDAIHQRYSSGLFGLNKASYFIKNNTKFIGTIRGISDGGTLLLELENGKLEAFRYPEVRMLYPSED